MSSISTQAGSQRTEGAANPPVTHDWAGLVSRIRNGEPAGLEQLYLTFGHGIRFHLSRHLSRANLEARFQEAFSILVRAIQRGDVLEPERLPGFIRTFLRGLVADSCESAENRELTDEQTRVIEQKAAGIRAVLEQFSAQDREPLIRFYLQEKTLEQVCQELTLTQAQFSRLKSRAQAQFFKIGNKKPPRAVGGPLSLTTSA